ncbi:unnamed protein product [Mytilus coruscus]|uniref:Endonuclease/exonuclease/phosphatase domain-containing protein n=1 Tax=Mytilus coruscus TaxID=42192 RepID=A0A6J8D027_MYTCO|nr:unnamed protein product [Mytilus coruscus]
MQRPVKSIKKEATIQRPAKSIKKKATIQRPVKSIKKKATIHRPVKSIKKEAIVQRPVKSIEKEATVQRPVKIIEQEATIQRQARSIKKEATIQRQVKNIKKEAIKRPCYILVALKQIQVRLTTKPRQIVLLSNFYDLFSKSLTFLHLNIQSLTPKLDLIAAEYQEFDILAFTESCLNSSHTDDSINLLNFHSPFCRDRGPHKLCGGVVVYVKNNLNVRRRADLEIDELEAIWLELKLQNKKILFGIFYISPNSGHETWVKVETSLDMALNDNKDNIVVSGDFNENQHNISNSKIKALINQFNLTQMIDEPTHFTENSSLLIDLIMTSNVNDISYCCVGPPLTDQIRYHCPVIGYLNFLTTPIKAFKRKIWLYDKGDYDIFRNTLDEAAWDTQMASDSVDEVTENMTNTILQAATISIPNKIITVRKISSAWLKNDIKKLLGKRIEFAERQKKLNNLTGINLK